MDEIDSNEELLLLLNNSYSAGAQRMRGETASKRVKGVSLAEARAGAEEEREAVSADLRSIGCRSWQDLAADLSQEEREALVQCPENSLWDPTVCLYLDLYADPSSGSERPRLAGTEALWSLSLLLRLRGARVSSSLSGDVTHVATDLADPSRLQRIQDRIRCLRLSSVRSFEKHIVSLAWLRDSLLGDSLRPADEP